MNLSKSLIAFIVLVIGVTMFTGCEKEEMTFSPEAEPFTLTEKPEANLDMEIATIEATDPGEEALGEVGLRSSGRVVLYSATQTVANGRWRLIRFSKASLLPGYKYTAVVTRISGDPDLYAFGMDLDNFNPFRRIRRSATGGVTESTYLYRHDLRAHEEYGYFGIYGDSQATYRIVIYRDDICGTEDCIPFDPSTVRAQTYGDKYRVVSSTSAMFLAPNATEARKIVSIIRHYGMNESCFVGRPGASFFYMKVNGNAPQGAMAGEDCIGFDIDNIEVVKINGRWKIVDDNHWIFDFEDKEDEARETLCLIKKYGFTKSCYVGRPGPSFQYMRK